MDVKRSMDGWIMNEWMNEWIHDECLMVNGADEWMNKQIDGYIHVHVNWWIDEDTCTCVIQIQVILTNTSTKVWSVWRNNSQLSTSTTDILKLNKSLENNNDRILTTIEHSYYYMYMYMHSDLPTLVGNNHLSDELTTS